MDKTHILSRLDINLKYDSGGETVDGKEVADRLTDDIFIPVLERVIDEYPEEEDICIDSIEVQVPPVSEEELPDAFESALREALSNAIASRSYPVPGTLPAASAREEIQRLKYLLAEDDSMPDSIPSQSTAAELLSLLSALTMPRVSAHGVIPGPAVSPDSAVSPGKGISDIPGISAGKFAPLFINELTQTEKIRLLVFIEQGRASAASGASEEILPEEAAVRLGAALREAVAAQDARALSSLDGRLASWRRYLSARKESFERPHPSAGDAYSAEDNVSVADADSTQDKVSVADTDSVQYSEDDKASWYPSGYGEPSEPSEYTESMGTSVEAAILPSEETVTQDGVFPESGRAEAEEEKATLPPEQNYWQGLENEQSAPDSRHFVNDAGLTLLHPFIMPLLQNMGLVKKGKFLSPEARVYAVHLLKELAYPGYPHFNHNLTLEKILCGLPPEFTVPEEWEPDDRAKEESEALLKAVCGHWEPLSRSTTTALRNGFLQRGGSVEMDQDTWIVRVEGSAMDILLDRLPWELSFIILPWNKKPILVEWQQESF